MKKILAFLVFFFSIHVFSQETGYVRQKNDSILESEFKESNELRIVTPADDSGEGIAVKFEPCRDGIFQVGESSIMYELNCEEKRIVFWIENYDQESIEIFYCESQDLYFNDLISFRLSCQEENEEKGSDYADITEIPFPSFVSTLELEEDINKDSENRVLLIDASSYPFHNFNTVLTKSGSNFTEAKALDKNGTLAVFLKNINVFGITEFTISLNEKEYTYKEDFEIVPQSKIGKDSTSEGLKELQKQYEGDENFVYLKSLYDHLVSFKSLSSNELRLLEIFKKQLSQTIEENSLSPEAADYYHAVMAWFPKWINLTPLPLSIADTDEVKIGISATGKDGIEIIPTTLVGNYRIKGGFVFDLGGKFYITGLKDNEVYTETVTVDNNEERLARINEEDQISIGYGINAEMSLRTGSAIRPTINLGTFIPFEEDISPYFAIGPGFSIQGEQVKLSFLGGLAYGSVNVINERYENQNLNQVNLEDVELGQKAWKASWFFGAGFRYNLKKDDDSQ